MEIDFAKIQEFTETISRASSVDEIADEFSVQLRDLGFDWYLMTDVLDHDDSEGTWVRIDRVPPEWSSRYMDQSYFNCDPTLKVALANNAPFTWDAPAVRSDLNTDQKQLYGEASDFGLKFGYTVPIYSVGYAPAIVSACSEHLEPQPQALHAVHLMAIYVHRAVARLAEKRNSNRLNGGQLSGRERECLRWVSVGKTDWEIGRILSISENTVHYHIERAKRKLGVTTRTQAVVNALFESRLTL